MSKFTLTSAISKYKKIKINQFLRLTEKEIGKVIADQIKLKEDEISDLKEDSVETSAEMKEDFQISLLDLNESAITNRSDRQETAEEYVLDALGLLSDISDFTTDKLALIKEKEAEIAQLVELRSQLETLESVIVVEAEEEN